MEIFEGNKKNRILVLGASGLTGGAIASTAEAQDAGIDVSPAVQQFLALNGIDAVDWRFVSSPLPGPCGYPTATWR